MKNYIKKLLLLVGCFLVINTSQAQSNRSPMDDIVNDLENARVSDMVKYFDLYVPITINNSQAIYSRNQAEVVLRDFLDKNAPKNFTITDNGSPDNTSKFIIANFNSPANLKYNVYILMKLKDGSFILQQITINKE